MLFDFLEDCHCLEAESFGKSNIALHRTQSKLMRPNRWAVNSCTGMI